MYLGPSLCLGVRKQRFRCRDKADNFPQTSDHTRFSNSVVDVFTQLNEALKLLKQVRPAVAHLGSPFASPG